VWTQSSDFISFAHPPSGVLPRKPRALIAVILIPNLSPFKSASFVCKAPARERPAVDDEPVTTVVFVAEASLGAGHHYASAYPPSVGEEL
jgi:hypothetical protein